MKQLLSKELTLFFLFIVFMCLSSVLFQEVLFTDKVYFATYNEQFDADKIVRLIYKSKQDVWFGYLLLTIAYGLKFILTSLCIMTGCFVLKLSIRFRDAFRICIFSESVFVIPLVLKFFYFLLIKTNFTLVDVQNFSPLSLLSVFDYHSLSAYLIYPFEAVNVFEVVYWFVLAYLLKQKIKENFDKSLQVILYGYVPALSVWILFVMFLSITFNPN
jgi:hypothetical protein